MHPQRGLGDQKRLGEERFFPFETPPPVESGTSWESRLALLLLFYPII